MVCLLTLGACTSTPVVQYAQIESLWKARETSLESVKAWQIQGRIILTTEEEGWQFNIRWQRQPGIQQIDITSPLGNSHVRITQDRYGARLIDENHNEHTAETMEALVANVTGWRLPLENLYFWVRGLPVPEQKAIREWDSQGRLTRVQQTGWDVQFDRYTRAGVLEFPDRLILRTAAKASEGGPEAKVHIAINRWSLARL